MGSPAGTLGQLKRGNWTLALLPRLALVFCFISTCLSEPVSLPFSICAPSTVTESNPLKRINVTAVYGQIYHANASSTQLKITAFGDIGDTLVGFSNTTDYLGESLLYPVVRRLDVFYHRDFHIASGRAHMILSETWKVFWLLETALATQPLPKFMLTLFDFCSDTFCDNKLLDILRL
jgi:hypothetical protein